MTANVETALARCYQQSKAGPVFRPNMCKQETREAYSVDSDGSKSATVAWYRTDHRLKVTGDHAPRGALLWWTGGSDGNGHVAIADGQGNAWSVDINRAGYWDRVPFRRISEKWYRLTFAGVSLDIDGVQVVPTPLAKPPAAAQITSNTVRLANMLNEDRVIDLNLLDRIIMAGKPAAVATAAKAAKWACIYAVRAVLAAAGR